MQTRCLQMSDVSTRSDDAGNLVLEGYFARYDEVYEVCEGATESIQRGAFAEAIKGDVRALYNHNTDIVLGRTGVGTLVLRDTDVGLWGIITINPKDSQAVDAYQRIARGDVSGCSFGFDIPDGGQTTTVREDGSVHWTITRVMPLYEVSPVTFPAYRATYVEARSQEMESLRHNALEAWKTHMMEVLKHGTESSAPEEAD